MRPLLKILFFLLLFTTLSFAQTTSNSGDCRTTIPICGDAPISVSVDGSGAIDDFDPDNIRQTGCLEKGSISSANIEHNTSWFAFRALTSGRIGFDIESLGVGGSTTITAEWDFAVYGPDADCASISDGTAQPMRCNYEVNDTNYTGIGVNPINGQVGHAFVKGSQNTYDEWLDISAGEIYYILVNNYNTNFNGDPESYTLTITGDSDALDCTFRDEFLGLDIVACANDTSYPDIVLSALGSPVGPDIANIVWSVDYDDDGVIDNPNLLSGPNASELIVTSPNSGRYFVEITTASGTPTNVTDDILITYHNPPLEADIEVVVLDYLADRNRVEVITNGFDDETSTREIVRLDKKFTISYIGLLPKQSNPKLFFRVLKELCLQNTDFKNDLQLNFIGDISDEVKKEVNNNSLLKNVNFVGYVSHREAIKYQKKAQVLLLLIPNIDKSEGILTGKLFEYLTAKRPILAIGPEKGDLSEILRDTNAGTVVGFNDEKKLTSEILKLYQQYKAGNLQVDSKNIHQFHRKELTKNLASIIKSLHS